MTTVLTDPVDDPCATGPVPLTAGPATWAAERGTSTAFTFSDHTVSPPRRSSLTWDELARDTDDLARRLRTVAEPGERCAIMLPTGLEFVVGMLAAVRAGLVAVPLFGPDNRGHAERVRAVLEDCTPALALATPAGVEAVEATGAVGRVLALGGTGDELPAPSGAELVDPDPDDVAYLQYTSGSTRTPAGVVVTHANVLANCAQLVDAVGVHRDTNRSVTWLPLFHDMGLVAGVLLPVCTGVSADLMDPAAFVQRPARWLDLLAGAPGTFSAAPNFAFDHCVRRVRDVDLERLDLSGVTALVNGSEPVRPATIERFAERFGPVGFRREAHRPSYGLAEATVFVATGPAGREPVTVAFDAERLRSGEAVPATDDDGARALVSCGTPVGQSVVVVDPVSRRPRPDGAVGELWCRGPNVAAAYHGGGERSRETFEATLADDARGGLPAGPWMRTGDLGVVHDGALFVTGRLKDTIIVDGRNHYPQDLEATAESADPEVRQGLVAAFGVDDRDEGEQVVVLAVRRRRDEDGSAARTVRRAVSSEHGVPVREVRFVPPHELPRTSSGKIARAACRRAYLADAGALR
ncbi:fatty acyl-AMP ligase [Actinomycetospora sp. TBRC 11914]|uniref:fatty acyl-AMP ligase n=1 Tax=Actinomycetospora sp. TBRC 11914 TaxID=2729387 RepID=UPI00145E34BC|nr:fatty acyl-AMP ligase [Actinomycetospora sp. TBRC 11914]NMO89027.1 fatty acyl-AMP ligase [Actinomycetospora sp. TBRC 11914]